MTYKLGLIGTGSQGQRLLQAFSKIDTARVEIVSNTRGYFQNYICKDWTDVVHSGINGLIIAADPALHDKILQSANFLQIPVLLEKPAGLYLHDVQKMSKYTIPILVDYTHLFSPAYQKMKSELTAPIESIHSMGCNFGPFRDFSALYDYAPHDLAMCLDLMGDLELVKQSVRPGQSGGNLYNFTLKNKDGYANILCGNGATIKQRKLIVKCTDGYSFLYNGDANADYQKPLENVVNHFIEILDGKECKVPISLTLKIHEILYKLGANYGK